MLILYLLLGFHNLYLSHKSFHIVLKAFISFVNLFCPRRSFSWALFRDKVSDPFSSLTLIPCLYRLVCKSNLVLSSGNRKQGFGMPWFSVSYQLLRSYLIVNLMVLVIEERAFPIA